MMPMAFGDWLALILSSIALAGIIYNWFTSGEKVNASEIAKVKEMTGQRIDHLSGRVDRNHDRLLSIENKLPYLPDKDAVHRLELTLKDMQTDMAKIGALAEQSARIGSRVETFLLEHGNK